MSLVAQQCDHPSQITSCYQHVDSWQWVTRSDCYGDTMGNIYSSVCYYILVRTISSTWAKVIRYSVRFFFLRTVKTVTCGASAELPALSLTPAVVSAFFEGLSGLLTQTDP